MYSHIMITIQKDGMLSINEQLEKIILDEIKCGILKPGDRIYSENSFAKAQGVSRTTIQKVYDRLVSRSVLIRKPGKGTFVAMQTTTESLSLLVGFTEKMQQQGKDSETRLLGIKVEPVVENIALALDLPINSEVISIERLRLVHGIPFVLHYAVLPYPLCKDVLDYDLVNGSLTDFLKFIMGFNLERTQEIVSAYPANAKDASILEVKQNFPILMVEGRTFDVDGQRVRYSVARYRSDIVRLESQHQQRMIGGNL